MKQVVDNVTLVQLWAQQKQASARNERGSLYFYGGTIYSKYQGNVLPIGCLASGVLFLKKEEWLLPYPIQKHVELIRSASVTIDGVRIMLVSRPEFELTEQSIYQFLIRELEQAMNRLPHYQGILTSSPTFLNYFDQFKAAFNPLKELVAASKTISGNREVRDESWKRASPAAKAKLRVLLRDIEGMAGSATAEEAKAFLEGYAKRKMKHSIQKFREFAEGASTVHTNLTYLRVRKTPEPVVESSRGISMSLNEAREFYAAFKRKKLLGTRYENHVVTKVANRQIVAGCHTIPFKEIELAAKELGLAS